MIAFVIFLLVVRATTASYKSDVMANGDNVCAMKHFDWFRTAVYVEDLFLRIEENFLSHAMYYNTYLEKKPKMKNVKIGSDTNPLSDETAVYQLLSLVRELHVSVLKSTDDCQLDNILTLLKDHNIVKMGTKDACSVGTNLRAIEHLAKLYSWLTSKSHAVEENDIKNQVGHSFVSLLKFVIPEFEISTGDIVIGIVDSVQFTQLKQAYSNHKFDYRNLDLFDVENGLPSDEAAYLIKAGVQTGPTGFHALMQYGLRYVETEGILREVTGIVDDANIRKIMFALIRKPLEIEQNKINEINDLFLECGSSARDTFVLTLKRFFTIISLDYETEFMGRQNGDETHVLIDMVHKKHGNHPCIEAMFFEVIGFMKLVAEQREINRMIPFAVARAISPSLVNIHGGIHSDPNDFGAGVAEARERTDVLNRFVVVLIENINFETINIHFTNYHESDIPFADEKVEPTGSAEANSFMMIAMNSGPEEQRDPESFDEPREEMSAGPSEPNTAAGSVTPPKNQKSVWKRLGHSIRRKNIKSDNDEGTSPTFGEPREEMSAGPSDPNSAAGSFTLPKNLEQRSKNGRSSFRLKNKKSDNDKDASPT